MSYLTTEIIGEKMYLFDAFSGKKCTHHKNVEPLDSVRLKALLWTFPSFTFTDTIKHC